MSVWTLGECFFIPIKKIKLKYTIHQSNPHEYERRISAFVTIDFWVSENVCR